MSAPIHNTDQNRLTDIVRDALQRAFGADRFAVRKLAAAAGCNERTAKSWLHGLNCPDLLHALRLTASVPEFDAAMAMLTASNPALDPEFARDMERAFASFLRWRERERAR